MEKEQKIAYLEIHIAVILFGITAILGKLIPVKAEVLVWHRLWISCIGLLLIPRTIRGLKKIERKKIGVFVIIGSITGLHWLTFYSSIKAADSASITLSCLATTTLFTSFLEPIITKSKIKTTEVVLGIFVILGIILIAGVGKDYFKAIYLGLISAFLASLFSSLNKKHLNQNPPLSVSFIELISAFVILFIYIIFQNKQFSFQVFSLNIDPSVKYNSLLGLEIHPFVYLLVLGLLCTTLAYVLALKALKHISAFSANLAVNLEPIYGIILAVLLFPESEKLGWQFYLGTTIVLMSVFLHPMLLRRERKKALIKSNLL